MYCLLLYYFYYFLFSRKTIAFFSVCFLHIFSSLTVRIQISSSKYIMFNVTPNCYKLFLMECFSGFRKSYIHIQSYNQSSTECVYVKNIIFSKPRNAWTHIFAENFNVLFSLLLKLCRIIFFPAYAKIMFQGETFFMFKPSTLAIKRCTI